MQVDGLDGSVCPVLVSVCVRLGELGHRQTRSGVNCVYNGLVSVWCSDTVRLGSAQCRADRAMLGLSCLSPVSLSDSAEGCTACQTARREVRPLHVFRTSRERNYSVCVCVFYSDSTGHTLISRVIGCLEVQPMDYLLGKGQLSEALRGP